MKNFIKESDKVLIGGHRGCKCELQENTIITFETGIEKGADYLELDVQMTRDRVLVLWHDEKYRGRHIMDTLFEELEESDNIETFDEVLLWLKRSGNRATIELKNIPTNDKRLTPAVVEKIREYDIFNQVVLMSFDHHIVKEAKEIEPRLTTSIVVGAKVLDPLALVVAAKADIFNSNVERLSVEMVDELKRNNIIVSGGFVKNEFLPKTIELGVDMFDTDYPDAAKKYLKENL